MTPPELGRQYHDGSLVAFTLGPRRELRLVIRLDPVWNSNSPETCELRFGAIGNYADVEAFFRSRVSVREEGDLDTIVSISGAPTGNVIIEFDHAGSIELVRPKVVES